MLGSQDMEFYSCRYYGTLVQKLQILLQKLSPAVYMFLFMLSTVLCVHVHVKVCNGSQTLKC